MSSTLYLINIFFSKNSDAVVILTAATIVGCVVVKHLGTHWLCRMYPANTLWCSLNGRPSWLLITLLLCLVIFQWVYPQQNEVY